MLGSCCTPADSWEDREAAVGKTTPPTPPAKGDRSAETGSTAATHRLRPRVSSAHLRNGKNTSCSITSQVAMSAGAETWEDPRWEAGTRLPAHPSTHQSRFGTSLGSAVSFLRSRTTLHGTSLPARTTPAEQVLCKLLAAAVPTAPVLVRGRPPPAEPLEGFPLPRLWGPGPAGRPGGRGLTCSRWRWRRPGAAACPVRPRRRRQALSCPGH